MRTVLAFAAAAVVASVTVSNAGSVMAPAAVGEDTIPPAVIAEGKAIFEGKRGALCVTCHAKNARGVTGLGPDLTDATWLHGDGSMAFLQNVIRAGILTPKKSASIMPPMGGASLNAEQVRAVAAYVYTLSAKGK